jgi:UDP-glucose 4-epimerase
VQRRVVVTGVAGFVGSNLAKKLLEKGYAVIGLDNLSAGTIENVDPRVDFHRGDIRSQEIYPLFEGADGVFHLAAKTSLVDCLAKPLEAADMNVSGTLNVLEAARKAKVRKFIYADTSAEYEGIHEFPTPEDRIQPIGVYAASKHGGATFCESYRRLYEMNVRMLQGENPLIYGTGEKRRDFIYVDDVNDLHLVILEDDRADGRVFNIGSGVNHSVNEIYLLVEGLLKTGLKPIYKPDLPGEAEITLADIAAAKSLGWKPHIDIKEGLKRTIDYLQSRVPNANASLSGRVAT